MTQNNHAHQPDRHKINPDQILLPPRGEPGGVDVTEKWPEFVDEGREAVPEARDRGVNHSGVTHNHTYHGPVVVVYGDSTGVTNMTGTVSGGVVIQNGQSHPIAPGFEKIAQAVESTLKGLSRLGLSDQDTKDACQRGEEVLEEVTAAKPDMSKISHALTTLRGWLAPVAMGLSAGAGEGAKDWAQATMEQLFQSLPS